MFSTVGYHAASSDEIVTRARVSKGAMYHHFKSKRELFEAVVIEVLSEYGTRLSKPRIKGADDWVRLIKLALRYLKAASADDAFRQVVLIDGPVVLGWVRWRKIQWEVGPVGFEAALENCMARGLIEPAPSKALAHTIIAAVSESVMFVAYANDREVARKEMEGVVTTLMNGFRIRPPQN